MSLSVSEVMCVCVFVIGCLLLYVLCVSIFVYMCECKTILVFEGVYLCKCFVVCNDKDRKSSRQHIQIR